MTSRRKNIPQRGHANNCCSGPPPHQYMGGPPPHQFMGGIPQDHFGHMDYYNPAFNAGYYGGHAMSHRQCNFGMSPPARHFHEGASRAYNQHGSNWWDLQQPSSSGNGHLLHQPSTSGYGRGLQTLE